jgi:translation initiation factor 2B subunit (eIF-2B alpha/beta/delta family)
MEKEILEKIKELVKQNPNDSVLGKVIRSLFLEIRESEKK